MDKEKSKNKSDDRKLISNNVMNQVHGAFATQAVTDTTERFEKTNIPKPSDENVKEGRDWVNFNKK
jgi:hypothetical protein